MNLEDSDKFCIVIVTYNGSQWLQRCLDSCKQYPMIIVDNASQDNTINIIRNSEANYQLIELEKNLGFGRANNVGIQHALELGVDYVFLLNQDAYLTPGTLEKLIEVHSSSPDFGILSPIHLNGDGTAVDLNFSNHVGARRNPDFYSDFILQKELQSVYEFDFVNAAAWLISSNALRTVGGFHPEFFMYGEDDNLCDRMRFHGFKIGVIPNVFIQHDRRQQRESELINRFSDKNLMRSRTRWLIAGLNINNTEAIHDLKFQLRKKRRQLLKMYITLRLNYASGLKKEINILIEVIRISEDSQSRLKSPGAHYLE